MGGVVLGGAPEVLQLVRQLAQDVGVACLVGCAVAQEHLAPVVCRATRHGSTHAKIPEQLDHALARAVDVDLEGVGPS